MNEAVPATWPLVTASFSLGQSNGTSVVERHRRQRRGTAVHHITLPDAGISLQHAVSSSNPGS